STASTSRKLSSVACMKPSATVTTALIAPAIHVGASALSRNLKRWNRTSISSATASVSMPSGKCTSRTWKRPRNQTTSIKLGPLRAARVHSSENALDHLAGGIGQAVIATLVVEGELLVVDAEQVEHGGVEVVHLDRVFDDVVAEVVGLA